MEKKLKDLNRSSHFLKSYIKQKEEDKLKEAYELGKKF